MHFLGERSEDKTSSLHEQCLTSLQPDHNLTRHDNKRKANKLKCWLRLAVPLLTCVSGCHNQRSPAYSAGGASSSSANRPLAAYDAFRRAAYKYRISHGGHWPSNFEEVFKAEGSVPFSYRRMPGQREGTDKLDVRNTRASLVHSDGNEASYDFVFDGFHDKVTVDVADYVNH